MKSKIQVIFPLLLISLLVFTSCSGSIPTENGDVDRGYRGSSNISSNVTITWNTDNTSSSYRIWDSDNTSAYENFNFRITVRYGTDSLEYFTDTISFSNGTLFIKLPYERIEFLGYGEFFNTIRYQYYPVGYPLTISGCYIIRHIGDTK